MMAKFKYDKSGLNNLIKSLKRIEDTPKEVEGSLFVDTQYLFDNMDHFNRIHDSNLNIDSSDDEIRVYFTNSYVEIIQNNLLTGKNPKDVFNSRYLDFAKID